MLTHNFPKFCSSNSEKVTKDKKGFLQLFCFWHFKFLILNGTFGQKQLINGLPLMVSNSKLTELFEKLEHEVVAMVV